MYRLNVSWCGARSGRCPASPYSKMPAEELEDPRVDRPEKEER